MNDCVQLLLWVDGSGHWYRSGRLPLRLLLSKGTSVLRYLNGSARRKHEFGTTGV